MRQVIIAILLSIQLIQAHGQGCSDPGICTIGTLNSGSTQDTVSAINFADADIVTLMNARIANEKVRIGVEFAYMEGEKGTTIYNTILRTNFRIKDKLMLGFKLPAVQATGDLGKNAGLGDLTISVTNEIASGKGRILSFTAGIVIPTNKANATDKGFVLPMAYQTSLGAVNALVGLSYKARYWNAVIGYQHNFMENGNEFARDALVLNDTIFGYDELNPNRNAFSSSRHLNRGGDLMLRLEGGYTWNKFTLFGGVLPIFRVAESTYLTNTGDRISIDGTNGLTLNITAGMSYRFNNNWSITGNYGTPVIQRDVRADGLTRKYVALIGLVYKIW